jgi:phenylacetic acid degradation operon negative regulatory protein
MKDKTDEFLNFLLWSMDVLARPSFRHLNDSYESWAYRNGFFRQVARLEEKKIVERDAVVSNDRVYRLTPEGRLYALGGRDPEVQWRRRWDGRWRLVLFDIPVAFNTHRAQLRQYLREKGFGYLQNSVWITPDPMGEERRILRGGRINVESLILLEAHPCAGESDAEIVAGAWDFERINRNYSRHLKLLDARPEGKLETEAEAKALLCWATAERKAWLSAVTRDPLLPEKILPDGYLGWKAWRRRIEVFREAGQQVQSFMP